MALAALSTRSRGVYSCVGRPTPRWLGSIHAIEYLSTINGADPSFAPTDRCHHPQRLITLRNLRPTLGRERLGVGLRLV